MGTGAVPAGWLVDPWGQHPAGPGRAGEEAGFWSCQALKPTVQVAADSKEEQEKEGIRRPGLVDKVFPNKGDRQQGGMGGGVGG